MRYPLDSPPETAILDAAYSAVERLGTRAGRKRRTLRSQRIQPTAVSLKTMALRPLLMQTIRELARLLKRQLTLPPRSIRTVRIGRTRAPRSAGKPRLS